MFWIKIYIQKNEHNTYISTLNVWTHEKQHSLVTLNINLYNTHINTFIPYKFTDCLYKFKINQLKSLYFIKTVPISVDKLLKEQYTQAFGL